MRSPAGSAHPETPIGSTGHASCLARCRILLCCLDGLGFLGHHQRYGSPVQPNAR
jgi:hypothetical protein